MSNQFDMTISETAGSSSTSDSSNPSNTSDPSNTSVTFVTGIFHIYQKDYDLTHKTIAKRIEYFEELALTGLQFCVYTDDTYADKIQPLEEKYLNVKVYNIHNIYSTNLGKKIFQYEKEIGCGIGLPKNVNKEKDTKEFLFIMNLKTELLKCAIDYNFFKSDYYAWIDFGIGYIFKQKELTLAYLKSIPSLKFVNEFVYIPGCWDKNNDRYKILINSDHYLTNTISWRYCGGFIIGDRNSICEFCNQCENSYTEFFKKFNVLVWEVNYWTWIERENKFNIIWDFRNHNDFMVVIPEKLIRQ